MREKGGQLQVPVCLVQAGVARVKVEGQSLNHGAQEQLVRGAQVILYHRQYSSGLSNHGGDSAMVSSWSRMGEVMNM